MHKCVHLHFVRPFSIKPQPVPLFLNNSPIQLQSSARDLGVKVDSSLKFHSHIWITSNKAFGVSYNLLRGTVCRSPELMKAVFLTHVRPILEYCSTV